jgi:hypothetical protein
MVDVIKNILARLVVLLLLLQQINISVHPPHLRQIKPSHAMSKEALSTNEIESVYELISEGVLEIDVPENDDGDDDSDIDTESQIFELYCFRTIFDLESDLNLRINHHSYYCNNFPFEFDEVNSPPPKYNQILLLDA